MDINQNQFEIKDFDNGVNFSVDAGLINRLGDELVGRSETAVSELIKNSYDADANNVVLNFIDSDSIGGTLVINDDGIGMNLSQLINGFMRLSSSDKLHNPVSPIYSRQRAGRKGIGRFATQRLGNKLSIITKSRNSKKGLMLEVDWAKYKIDTDLTSILNPISEVDVDFDSGTILRIGSLKDVWTDSQIKRVFRYISDLLQPDFLSKLGSNLNIAKNNSDGYFNVKCLKTNNSNSVEIASVDTMVFDNALGIIEGHVENKKGVCNVVSNRFGIDDNLLLEGNFDKLEGRVHFKAYYFIYNYEWYEGYIPKMEYQRIKDLSEENGGIKLYRNGFRVLPYGEKGNDWANIEKSNVRTQDNAYVPFNNNSFFGFVEIVDRDGNVFEETSSREGLIENEAFTQLTNFISNSLRQAALRINAARFKEKKNRSSPSYGPVEENPVNTSANTQDRLLSLKGKSQEDDLLIDQIINQLEENEMLRVLAGMGLIIAEFTHEIRQFVPSFNGSINFLLGQDNLKTEAKESLKNLKDNFNRFKTYTSYIDNTITSNVNRNKQPLDIVKVVNEFKKIVSFELENQALFLNTEFYGYDLFTESMHPSEWSSILYNLYTNSKKAIKRAEVEKGNIKIICGRENGMIYLEFMDNGDGIPKKNQDRIFDAFFTTSASGPLDLNRNEAVTGTGLGLKIVRDIVLSYGGNITLIDPESNFSTCFKIQIPEATFETLQNYGY